MGQVEGAGPHVFAEKEGKIYSNSHVEDTSWYGPKQLWHNITSPSRLDIKASLAGLYQSVSRVGKSIYENSFGVIGPRLWNILPYDVSVAESLETFKNKMAKFVRNLLDEPPVRGYMKTQKHYLM